MSIKPQPLPTPPGLRTPLTDELWRRWHYSVYSVIGDKGAGKFPKLQVSNATFTDENAFQDLLNVDKGLYVTYSSTVDQIIYGFACNVKRAKGASFVVGAQINSWSERGATGGQWGIATEALSQPGSNNNLIGLEASIVEMNDATMLPKFGINAVFKDRLDGAPAAGNGLGSNFYNYWSRGLVFSSQSRSTSTEYCGWNVGIEFGDGWGDQELVPAYSAVTTYLGGQCVSSGGVVWKAITTSLNQAPAAGSAYWVQRTVGTTNNLAVGIDFSSMSLGSMARMSSAIRLRSTQSIHWEETGQVGTYFDAATSLMHLVQNGAAGNMLTVHVGTGNVISAGTILATDFIGPIGATTPNAGTFTTLTVNTSSVFPTGTWTPSVTSGTGAFTAVSATGKWTRIGNLYYFYVEVTITTNGTAATSVNFTLHTAATRNGTLAGRENGVTGNGLIGDINSGSATATILNYNNSYPGNNGSVLKVSGFFAG